MNRLPFVINDMMTYLNHILTLPPPPRKLLWIFFFGFAWGFCIQKCRGFLVSFFFSGLRFPRNEARKLLERFGKNRSKLRGKIRDENSKNSENFRSATFSDVTYIPQNIKVGIGNGIGNRIHCGKAKVGNSNYFKIQNSRQRRVLGRTPTIATGPNWITI